MPQAQLVAVAGFEWHIFPERRGRRRGNDYIRHLSENNHLRRIDDFMFFALKTKTQGIGSVSASIEIKCEVGKRFSQWVIRARRGTAPNSITAFCVLLGVGFEPD